MFFIAFFVRKTGFIVDTANQLDLRNSMTDMKMRLCDEFVEHLQQGPFLCELSIPVIGARQLNTPPHL